MLRCSPAPRGGGERGVLIRLLFILLLIFRNHQYSWRISLFKHSVCLLAEERRANYSIFYCLFFSEFATADFLFGWVDGLGGWGGGSRGTLLNQTPAKLQLKQGSSQSFGWFSVRLGTTSPRCVHVPGELEGKDQGFLSVFLTVADSSLTVETGAALANALAVSEQSGGVRARHALPPARPVALRAQLVAAWRRRRRKEGGRERDVSRVSNLCVSSTRQRLHPLLKTRRSDFQEFCFSWGNFLKTGWFFLFFCFLNHLHSHRR